MDNKMNKLNGSRFANCEEIFSSEFEEINSELLKLNVEHKLPDHSVLNKERFGWWREISSDTVYYGSRFWEYPFAIRSSELNDGLKCADIGCGTTPFLVYLANKVGSRNVTGFDPDLIQKSGDTRHSAFGIREKFIDHIGINFSADSMTKLNAESESFDRVFCLSVLEHTPFETQIAGLKEMVRILKPGGKLILTMDLGINLPLTFPLDLIKFSGLTPHLNVLDLKWPEKRFVRYEDGQSVDVFGLVLEKPVDQIYADHNAKRKIDYSEANARYLRLYDHLLVSYNEALFVKEYRMNPYKAILKLLLKKYA
ncbi:MAG: 2-polyprenyl-3-methyl-5-hydroxy-6-metoxy-1,4-benzoquinol methylase [Cyclobacteriaceae bacterium]|jgi:2-polyprenyl-3-methyl-5-hydroxy-6-metoxy-1,4-benzoquinol methylase